MLLNELPAAVQVQVGLPGNCPPDPTQGQLSKAQVLHVVQKLRSWAPRVLRERPDADDVQPDIESVVQWLLNIRAALVSSGERCHDRELLGVPVSVPRSLHAPHTFDTSIHSVEGNMRSSPPTAASKFAGNNRQIDGLQELIVPWSQQQALLDVALLLWVRSQQVASNVRFTGGDASPQCGHNWLLSNSVSLRVDMLPQLYGAGQRMIADCRQRTAVPDDVFEQSEQSISDHELIVQHVRQLHDVPVALGNAAASTGHKCAVMLHKWGLIVRERERYGPTLSPFSLSAATWAQS